MNPFPYILDPILDFLYPPTCFGCNALLPDAHARICTDCYASFRPVLPCDSLLRRARTRLGVEGTMEDLDVLWYVDDNGPLRTLLHKLKYGGAWSIGVELGARLGASLRAQGAAEADVIIPVPLHRSKLRERGFNQSACIARGIAAGTGIAVREDSLTRVRWTPSQTSLGFGERLANIPGAFRVPPRKRPALDGRKILLVDDVVTTGATLHACAAELKRAGARSIVGCALALAA